MARRARSIEILEKLIEWTGGSAQFRHLTGIAAPNLSDYQKGKKSITYKRLKRCAEQIFGVPPAFRPIVECHKLFPLNEWLRKEAFEGISGVYAFYDSGYCLLYFGKASNLYTEIKQSLGREARRVHRVTSKGKVKFRDITFYVSAYSIPRGDNEFRHDLEALVLRMLINSSLNERGGNFIRKN